jgi:hypothetical protein
VLPDDVLPDAPTADAAGIDELDEALLDEILATGDTTEPLESQSESADETAPPTEAPAATPEPEPAVPDPMAEVLAVHAEWLRTFNNRFLKDYESRNKRVAESSRKRA